jgi:hypothetical protein
MDIPQFQKVISREDLLAQILPTTVAEKGRVKDQANVSASSNV